MRCSREPRCSGARPRREPADVEQDLRQEEAERDRQRRRAGRSRRPRRRGTPAPDARRADGVREALGEPAGRRLEQRRLADGEPARDARLWTGAVGPATAGSDMCGVSSHRGVRLPSLHHRVNKRSPPMPFAVLLLVALARRARSSTSRASRTRPGPVGDRRPATDASVAATESSAHDASAIPGWRGCCAAGSTRRRRPVSRSPLALGAAVARRPPRRRARLPDAVERAPRLARPERGPVGRRPRHALVDAAAAARHRSRRARPTRSR